MVVAGAKAVGISPMSRVGCESLKARAFAVPKPLKTTLIHSKSNINEIFGKTITNREILKQKNCGLVCLAAQENGNGASLAPSPADTARTIVDLVAHGTLSSLTEDGTPLGTYVSYVLDQVGQPILRLRKDAAHCESDAGKSMQPFHTAWGVSDSSSGSYDIDWKRRACI